MQSLLIAYSTVINQLNLYEILKITQKKKFKTCVLIVSINYKFFSCIDNKIDK